jgi:DNA-binding transcriptional LysR family regulator
MQFMDWNDIPVFLAVARLGSLAAASRHLGINHSTVYRRLRAMEARLGVSLFDRLPEGYALTTAGRQALEHARGADDAIMALERTAAGQDLQLSGDIRLTTTPPLASDFVAPCVAAFRRHHPGIRVEIAVGDSDYDLARREADLALRATSSPPDFLVGRKVMEIPWYVYGGERYLAECPTQPTPERLEHYDFVGGDHGLRRLPALAWLRQTLPPERITATANTLDTVAALSVAGLGLAVLPADQSKPGLKRLFPLQPRFASDLWLLTHADLKSVARIKVFSDYLLNYLKNDPRLCDL